MDNGVNRTGDARGSGAPAVHIERLRVSFPIRKGVLGTVRGHVHAVDDVSLTIDKGEVFALVGESGCGKTTTALAAMHLIQPSEGAIAIAAGPWKETGTAWESLTPDQRRTLRRYVQFIFQDPFSSLNPRMTVRAILEEPLTVHGLEARKDRRSAVARLMDRVGLSTDLQNRYPHEFSGGQRQRIGIARALATNPEIVIADEPVSALDVSIQAQIINLLQDLQQQDRLTLLFISHDLAIVRHVADRLAVMYLGRIMETGRGEEIFRRPLHPYSQLLLSSVPAPGKGRAKEDPLPTEEIGTDVTSGCPFAPRCRRKRSECLERQPSLQDAGGGHWVACVGAG